jgi:Uma2 family endonuclease
MEKITQLSQLDINSIYSYADYLTWQFEQTVELIRGKILQMAAPGRKHQRISWELGGQFYRFFQNQRCQAYTAPFDVRLHDKKKSLKVNKDVFTVVQPDLCVICDLDKLDDNGCLGSPDLIIEILSPGNSSKEMKMKKQLYEESGVREYWIIDPIRELLVQYVLDANDKYSPPQILFDDETVDSAVFEGLSIVLKELFVLYFFY